LWDLFFQFTQTPRPSKNEIKAQKLLINIAKENNLEFKQDTVGNIIIYVPGKGSRRNDEPFLIQNHIDMVTDAIKGKEINFNQDPIEVFVDGEWLKAKERL
jgi:dipeptidase D